MNRYDSSCAPAMAVHMADDLYRELAELARIEADMTDGDSAKIVVEAERDGYTHILHLDCLLTFDVDYSPCGRPLVYLHRITPTWIHCETYDQFGEQRANDFDIKKFKQLL